MPEPGTSTPTQRPRIDALDALRGFALCGIIFINIPQTLEMYESIAELPEALRWFVLGRFYPIFYLLFGIGFGIFLRSATARVERPRAALIRRFTALAVMGALHHLLQPGEVLLPFAIAGFVVLLPLSYLARRASVVIGVALTILGLLAGVGGFALLPGLFALGFALAELNVPQTLSRRAGQLVLIAGLAAVAALGSLALITVVGTPAGVELRLGLLLQLSMSILYGAVFLLLLRTPVGSGISAVLAPMGRMALTNYLSATVLFVSIGTAIGLSESTNWSGAILLGVGVLLVQAVWSPLWLSAFRYGPLEWLWRCVTYWQWVPIRRPTELRV